MANNIILQTIKEVEFFNTRVYLEIFAKERQAYLILSKQKPFDIDNLKKYLIENNLNQFAKKEIIRLIEVIDYFADLNTKHKEIPIINNFYNYKNDNNGGKTECAGWGNLFYILNTNDRFIKTNEDNFKEKHKSNLIFTFLIASRISTKLNEIKDLLNEYLEPITFKPEPTIQPETIKPNESKKQTHGNIFVDNSLEIWKKMFEDFNIDASKRTDLDFMFQIMKYESLIHENIGFIDMQNWINKTYQITIEKLKYTDVNTKANEKRMTVYNLITSKQ